jgi:hypothetical protein
MKIETSFDLYDVVLIKKTGILGTIQELSVAFYKDEESPAYFVKEEQYFVKPIDDRNKLKNWWYDKEGLQKISIDEMISRTGIDTDAATEIGSVLSTYYI